MTNKNKTASLLVIGNEILSGRTQDKNLNYIATKLVDMGIDFVESRVVRDVESEIVFALNELSRKYDYVFTTGGIGPTHDDITTESVAKAFGVKVILHPQAKQDLEEYYKAKNVEVNESRLKMATTPEGAELIPNPLTSAPGYRIGNVFVLAGIPSIMRVMFDYASQYLENGKKMLSETISCDLVEGDIAKSLDDIQNDNTDCEIGSYPFVRDGKYSVSVVIRSIDQSVIDKVADLVKNSIIQKKGNIIDPK
jgi:molybdenum cofactor synthesis domain-containing protein